MSKSIQMRYPDGSIHYIKPQRLVFYKKKEQERYILHYYDYTAEEEMFTLLENRDGIYYKVPLRDKKDYSRLAREEGMMIISSRARFLNVSVLQDFIELNKPLTAARAKSILIIYYDNFGNYYRDENMHERVSREELEELKKDPSIQIEYRPIELHSVKHVVIIYYDEHDNYYGDPEGTMKLTEDQVEQIKADPRLKVEFRQLQKKMTKSIIYVYYDEQGRYYGDPEGRIPLTKDQLEQLEANPRLEVRYKPIKLKMTRSIINIYYDNRGNYYSDPEGTIKITKEQLELMKADPRLEIEYVPVRNLLLSDSFNPTPRREEPEVKKEEPELIPITLYIDLEGNYYIEYQGKDSSSFSIKLVNKISEEEVMTRFGSQYLINGVEISPIKDLDVYFDGRGDYYVDTRLIFTSSRCFEVHEPFKILNRRNGNLGRMRKITNNDMLLLTKFSKAGLIKVHYNTLDLGYEDEAPSTGGTPGSRFKR